MDISKLKVKLAEKEVASEPSSSRPLVKREKDNPEVDEPIKPGRWLRPNLGCGRNYMD
jgi:hypothetical protein